MGKTKTKLLTTVITHLGTTLDFLSLPHLTKPVFQANIPARTEIPNQILVDKNSGIILCLIKSLIRDTLIRAFQFTPIHAGKLFNKRYVNIE